MFSFSLTVYRVKASLIVVRADYLSSGDEAHGYRRRESTEVKEFISRG